jgi:DNA-directed RNA polymerase specialized sigma subunit
VIKKYYSASNDQDDLISIGIIGLIKAIKTFDCTKNTTLRHMRPNAWKMRFLCISVR